MASDIRDRLQPALLDRLTDDHRSADGRDSRVMTRAQLRAAVVRDLAVLLNTVQPLRQQMERHPVLAASVLNFGLPSLAGRPASDVDIRTLEDDIAKAIARFEPRILADSLVVRAIASSDMFCAHNVIELEIRGQLWSQPLPLEILLRTRLNLEAGQAEVHDTTSQPADASQHARH